MFKMGSNIIHIYLVVFYFLANISIIIFLAAEVAGHLFGEPDTNFLQFGGVDHGLQVFLERGMCIRFKGSVEYLQLLYAAYPEIAIAVTQLAPADKMPRLAVVAKPDGLNRSLGNGILSALVADVDLPFIAQCFLQIYKKTACRVIGRHAAEHGDVVVQLVHMLFVG